MRLLAGLDDVGTETQLSEGWALVALPDSAVTRVLARLQGVNDGTMPYFHGKKFIRAESARYEGFLRILREEAEAAPSAVLAFTLMDLTWKGQFIPFIDRIVAGAIAKAGISDPTLVDQARRLFPGIATLMRMLSDVGAAHVLEIEIDQDAATKGFNTSTFTKGGRTLPSELVLRAVYRAYRTRTFPNTPDIAQSGISIVNDKSSILVQAADVLGNFAMSYAFSKLGRQSKKIAEKGAIFERVFGDLIANVDVTSMARLVNNDFELLRPGAMTLRMSANTPS